MYSEPTLDQLRERVQKWASCNDSISAVFLFGSRARNDQNPKDWDICVLIDEGEYESWYSTWHFNCSTWKKEFCLATGLPDSDKTQFCTVTSHEVLSGLFASNTILYQDKKDIACIINNLSSWLLNNK
ncbi:MAG: nucleotidyltransferase domain-containing protein [Candidatus Thiodiazotropha lotti]|nr:nucleotidyltransferase domain-containing protein [Candidatus Thiodiazotropha lotti]MCG8004624.1 nucleotidyltransferase domain-containing protein [Candidatus Thiodiazotropha lotti]MCG8006641.1 nucleotidyltransferase domain-containing protein [Candidatus Thiodiazotropha lotti]MCW4188251.1 nucleotidyltransferase domain-containing protein [Candidatus Thiodiazotropha lotti]MCW4194223.1 nucleotidyltransferase domain-containing protein [Candidatus Thiodiazotropha lotti]